MTSAARLKSLEQGQSALAKKVLEAVPIQEQWDMHKIHGEMARVGHPMERRVLEGCLRTLVEAGLVREPNGSGVFQRVTAKLMTVHREELDPKDFIAEVTPDVPLTPSERLADLASELRTISTTASQMASRMDDIAVDFLSAMQKLAEEGDTIRQFKDLLNKIK